LWFVAERQLILFQLTAAHVAAAAEYLLGDGASNVTGTTLYVDSGYHAMGM
jgi:enoyl-[acyl-carrier-protein] reductase (NADH)